MPHQLQESTIMDKHYITAEAFGKIFVYLSGKKEIYCRNREKTRNFLEAVYFIMRTGAQWLELPKFYGNYKTVHKRFLAWAKKGIWNDILSYCSKDHDGESFMIDGSIIRAHACASGYQKNQQFSELGTSKNSSIGFKEKWYSFPRKQLEGYATAWLI